MTISKGLIIADPWIGYILNGSKTWEMRSTPTSQRGWFGLIRKGSGQVHGIARLVACGEALSQEAMLATIEHHRIPDRLIRSGEVAKWVVPWELANVILLPRPVPYQHRSGAVTWVTFDPDVQAELDRHIPEGGHDDMGTLSRKPLGLNVDTVARSQAAQMGNASEKPGQSSRAPVIPNLEETVLGRVTLSGGNIRNNHFKLAKFLDRFPSDTIGGRNKSLRAPKDIKIDWGGPHPVHTDIDGSKQFFRARGWVGDFFAATNATENDRVVVFGLSPYSVRVKLEKQHSH